MQLSRESFVISAGAMVDLAGAGEVRAGLIVAVDSTGMSHSRVFGAFDYEDCMKLLGEVELIKATIIRDLASTNISRMSEAS